MSDDIYFYDFELNKIYELPCFGVNKGYISVNATAEFNGSGSLEIEFSDKGLTELLKEYRDRLIVIWRSFQGFITGYQLEEKKSRMLGMSLNGLLNRVVIPKTLTTLSGSCEELARAAIEENAQWLSLGDEKGFTNTVTYSTDKYMKADKYIEELLKLDNAGYRIWADVINKQFIFEVLKSEETELLLSTNNLNAYDFSESYSNKPLACGGWYEQEQAEGEEAVWTYITLDDTLSGINRIDTVLTAKNEEEAHQELTKLTAENTVDLKTRRIIYGEDYTVGDIVRVQHDGTAIRKRVTGVNMAKENGYIENPILEEVE